jgi:hypothetical protein
MNDVTQLNFTNTEPSRESTDAELLAGWATEALYNRRYALAVELTKLADRAARVGTRPAGHDAAQRDLFGPGAVAVPMIGRTRDERPREALSHAPQQCSVPIMGQGIDGPCNAPIRYSDGSHGSTVGWYHLDPEVTDHEALPIGY